MYYVVIHTPDHEPSRIPLNVGKLTIGRAANNNLVLEDSSASRMHAEISMDDSLVVFVTDLNSTNGTFVNRQRISGTLRLNVGDLVRIGQVVIQIMKQEKTETAAKAKSSHMFTRELLLESLDQHSILLYEVARKLNLATTPATMSNDLAQLVKNSLGVANCIVLMRSQLDELGGNPSAELILRVVKNRSAEITPSEMFVPIMLSEGEVMGVLCMSKSLPVTRPFEHRDLQVAVAISYQAALTIQRMMLLDQVRKEEQARQLLMRFVSPAESKFLLQDYLKSGKLPPLRERKVTILFADIADSTGMGEKLGPQRFADILNKFYADAVEIIFKHHGILKYLGDGIMAIFLDAEAPDMLPSEERATVSGYELLHRTKTTGRLQAEHRTVIGVSINTGVAMVGYIGTSERPEFNALGDVVNVAFRMQEYARPNRIVAGPATIAAIVDKYRVQRIGEISLKGRAQTVQVYEILP
jgi:class 3 adenylate cyclase/pSer/pThr/pTyr-binding forkhead associated (FHA) protein